MPLNPAFERNPWVAIRVGRMLLNYGEIELLVATCLANAIGDLDVALKAMFRISGETARVTLADALMRKAYTSAALGAEYADTYGAVLWCIKARNQYAHCHWADDPNVAGIYFSDLSNPAKAAEGFDHWFKHLSHELLEEQFSYFEYAGDCLHYLLAEFRARQGLISGHNAAMPSKRKQPMLHSPPELFVPPWLTEEEKRRHIERSQAEKPANPQQRATPKPRPPSSKERREKAMKPKDLN